MTQGELIRRFAANQTPGGYKSGRLTSRGDTLFYNGAVLAVLAGGKIYTYQDWHGNRYKVNALEMLEHYSGCKRVLVDQAVFLSVVRDNKETRSPAAFEHGMELVIAMQKLGEHLPGIIRIVSNDAAAEYIEKERDKKLAEHLAGVTIALKGVEAKDVADGVRGTLEHLYPNTCSAFDHARVDGMATYADVLGRMFDIVDHPALKAAILSERLTGGGGKNE